MKTNLRKSAPVNHHEEHILVVKRTALFPPGTEWQGLKPSSEELIRTITTAQEFHPRSLMETDPTYKQIIPYLVFRHENRYFLMQRRSEASEQRLKNKYSLGIGGHIRQEDITSPDIIGWAQREFKEEVSYQGSYSVTPLGILNDDSSEVGQVHIGVVLLLEGDSDKIRIASELKSGSLYTVAECAQFYEHMEEWSKTVFNTLRELRPQTAPY